MRRSGPHGEPLASIGQPCMLRGDGGEGSARGRQQARRPSVATALARRPSFGLAREQGAQGAGRKCRSPGAPLERVIARARLRHRTHLHAAAAVPSTSPLACVVPNTHPPVEGLIFIAPQAPHFCHPRDRCALALKGIPSLLVRAKSWLTLGSLRSRQPAQLGSHCRFAPKHRTLPAGRPGAGAARRGSFVVGSDAQGHGARRRNARISCTGTRAAQLLVTDHARMSGPGSPRHLPGTSCAACWRSQPACWAARPRAGWRPEALALPAAPSALPRPTAASPEAPTIGSAASSSSRPHKLAAPPAAQAPRAGVLWLRQRPVGRTRRRRRQQQGRC